jgi:hypothetical protein
MPDGDAIPYVSECLRALAERARIGVSYRGAVAFELRVLVMDRTTFVVSSWSSPGSTVRGWCWNRVGGWAWTAAGIQLHALDEVVQRRVLFVQNGLTQLPPRPTAHQFVQNAVQLVQLGSAAA